MSSGAAHCSLNCFSSKAEITSNHHDSIECHTNSSFGSVFVSRDVPIPSFKYFRCVCVMCMYVYLHLYLYVCLFV